MKIYTVSVFIDGEVINSHEKTSEPFTLNDIRKTLSVLEEIRFSLLMESMKFREVKKVIKDE